MGNTELRGKVIWFLLTCRPDLLPADLKGQGRAEEHLALFYPATDEERLAMLHAMEKKIGMRIASSETEQFFLRHSAGVSGADVEAVLIRARMKSAMENEAALGEDDLKGARQDFVPLEIELQTLAAVPECASKSLLPATWTAAKSSVGPASLGPCCGPEPVPYSNSLPSRPAIACRISAGTRTGLPVE
jgi:SpoVK/Ycf46/Vps4 family AAA+-type ATPase